jgi:hypothetical protein
MKTQPAPGVAIFCLAYFPIRSEAQSAEPLSGRQTKPNKSKENQEKRLGFPWNPLAELRLFKGLQRIQIKKILCRSRALSDASQPDILSCSQATRWLPRIEICISWDFGLVQKVPTFGFA